MQCWSPHAPWIVNFHFNIYIVYSTGAMCFRKIFWPLQVIKVKSEVAPYCKLTFVMKNNYVPRFMLLSKKHKKAKKHKKPF